VAQRLVSAVRQSDTVARLGGDEFTIVLEDVRHDPGCVDAIAAKVVATIREPFVVEGRTLRVSASVGVALHRPGGTGPTSAEDLLARADAAMYSSKRTGKDGYTLAPPALATSL
jgi:diguanylate cyclase (GGDEF)-like protein